jgi:hypothetical protein
MTTAEILSRLSRVTKTADGWMAQCPAHADKTPSLSVSETPNGNTLFHDFGGCQPESICAAIGLTVADLFANKSGHNGASMQKLTPDEAARNAARIYADAQPVVSHPYLARKGIKAHEGMREHEGVLIVPLRNEAGEIRSIQRIWPGGSKKFLAGSKVKGLYFALNNKPDGPLLLAEGLATAASLYEATRMATWMALDCGNLQTAARIARKKFASRDILLCADDDGQQGIAKATGAARAIDGKLAVPKFADGKVEGKDFNDLARLDGLEAVKQQVSEALAGPSLKPEPDGTAKAANAASAPTNENFDAVTAWIRGKILDAANDDDTPATVKNTALANDVVQALARVGRFYYHADLRDFGSAMFFDGNRKRLERLGSDAFAAWLADWLRVNRAAGLFKFVLSAVETAALSGPHTTGILPESYWAARPGALYLSNGDGAMVKITAGAVELVDNGTDGVLFASGKTLAPWKPTTPKDPFETCALFRKVHCGAAHGKLLLQLWAYSFPTTPRSKPPLAAIGEVGSGKTRTLKGIAELYGIPFRAAKVEETLEPNFWPSVNEGGVYVLDNADSKCRWLPDAIASAATDGCSVRRKLYTDAELVTHRPHAWLGITSANPLFGADVGLADRLLVVRMERRGDETSDAALTDEILANRDAGLSHIAATLQRALADTGPTLANLNARHPDFAEFAVKIGRALGRESEAVAALRTAEADKSAFCLENDAVGAALLAHLNGAQSFTGTATELAPHIIAADKDLEGKLSAKRLGKRLVALWPHLEKTLKVCRKEADRTGLLHFTLSP